jgi:FtsP/CotA-like multicopper oxidase with cupredoxin domain
MSRSRLVIIGAVIVVFVAVGAIIAFRSSGGGGQARSFTLTVANGKMTPDKIEAKSGDTLTVTIVKDQDGEVHLHGYDLHFEARAGVKDTKTFKADKTGSFEIELEATSTHLGELDVNP